MNKQQRYRRRMKERGLCAHCGKLAIPGGTECEQRRDNQTVARAIRSVEVPQEHCLAMYLQHSYVWLDAAEVDDEQVRRLRYATRSPRFWVDTLETNVAGPGPAEQRAKPDEKGNS